MIQWGSHLLRFHDYWRGDYQSDNSSCPMLPAKWCFGSDKYQLCIFNPTLLPTTLLALLIGVWCSRRISQLSGPFPSRWYYKTVFALYGIMMTSAGIVHCVMSDQQTMTMYDDSGADDWFNFIENLVWIIDVGLTSNIAVTFVFCGLCDIRLFKPQSSCTRSLLYVCYFVVFAAWTLATLYNQWTMASRILYNDLIAISCLIYLITQLFVKTNRQAFPALIIGGLYGAIGLVADTVGVEHICRSEGPFWSQYIGPEFIWFLFSDISMAFIYLYVMRANQQNPPTLKQKNNNNDFEKQGDKF